MKHNWCSVMETIKVDSVHDLVPLPGAEIVYARYKDALRNIPLVACGAVEMKQADSWLRALTKLHPEEAIPTLIKQSMGFGASDIRTIIAHERNEYFPRDSAGEVFDRKRLLVIPAPNTQASRLDALLIRVGRNMIMSRYSVKRNRDAERWVSTTNSQRRFPWLVGRPALIGQSENLNVIFDIKISNKAMPVDQDDIIRLHYYDLIGNDLNANGPLTSAMSMFRANLVIDEGLAKAFRTLAETSSIAEQQLLEMAFEIGQGTTEGISIVLKTLQSQDEIYQEILETGFKHWNYLLTDNRPSCKTEASLNLPAELMTAIEGHAKDFLAASQLRRMAKEHEAKVAQSYMESVAGLNINENFTWSYQGVTPKKVDKFDLEGAADYLEKKCGVDPRHIREEELNIDSLKQAFVKLGGDLGQHKKCGDPVKERIEGVAEMKGIRLDVFYDRSMTPEYCRQTRGTKGDAMESIREAAKAHVETAAKHLALSDAVDSPAFKTGLKPVPKKQETKMSM